MVEDALVCVAQESDLSRMRRAAEQEREDTVLQKKTNYAWFQRLVRHVQAGARVPSQPEVRLLDKILVRQCWTKRGVLSVWSLLCLCSAPDRRERSVYD